jgi:hypothetical protein
MSALAETLEINVRDVAGQRPFVARGLRRDLSIGELVQNLAEKMNLPKTDAAGTPHSYHAYLSREARHLYAAETVGEVLKPRDEVVLQPDVQAG